MTEQFRTMIVPLAEVQLVRDIAASFGPGGVGMWTTELSATGSLPATHYISTGWIPEQFAYLLTDIPALHEAANANGVSCTLEEVTSLVDNSDVTEEEPFAAMSRLGLQLISVEVVL